LTSPRKQPGHAIHSDANPWLHPARAPSTASERSAGSIEGDDAPDFHGNEAETSVLLYLSRHVAPERAVDESCRTPGCVLLYPMPAVTTSGVAGSRSRARAQRGEELVDQFVSAIVDLLTTASLFR
jgi:creatinine amidohydrolase/Fe(II)-dependent formamide hydrolase-like protein